jgi:ribosome recycling factor
MDHALRSWVDKKSGYNLINPKIVLPLPPKTFPMTKRKESKKNIKNYLKELKEVCSQQLRKIENSFKKISKINDIGAIKLHLEPLTL